MIYVSTRAGNKHKQSEDAVLVGSELLFDACKILPIPDDGFVCVSDGVGGNRGGAQAARFILEELPKWTKQPEKDMKEFLLETNDALIEKASQAGTAKNMAATLSGVFISGKGCILIHIGNTRVYVKQGRYLKQLTSDHTTYNWLTHSGRKEDAENCNKNEITNCFGGGDPALLAKLYIADCKPFSLALLTSDGVHEYVDLDTLEDILAVEGTYTDKCEQILHSAVEAGSEDDLSAVIICLSEE